MNKHEIPDDMRDLLLTEEERTVLMKASKGATRRKSRAPKTRFKFTMFPDEWEYQLARVQAEGGVYRVALYLLRETWRAGSNRVKLANEVLKARGVSRWQKYHALDLLGSLGLISTERGSRKSPIVTVKFTD